MGIILKLERWSRQLSRLDQCRCFWLSGTARQWVPLCWNRAMNPIHLSALDSPLASYTPLPKQRSQLWLSNHLNCPVWWCAWHVKLSHGSTSTFGSQLLLAFVLSGCGPDKATTDCLCLSRQSPTLITHASESLPSSNPGAEGNQLPKYALFF